MRGGLRRLLGVGGPRRLPVVRRMVPRRHPFLPFLNAGPDVELSFHVGLRGVVIEPGWEGLPVQHFAVSHQYRSIWASAAEGNFLEHP